MESYYEINISKDGKHFFATAPRSARNWNDFILVLKVLREKFPESEGYEFTLTHWEGLGHILDINNIKEETKSNGIDGTK